MVAEDYLNPEIKDMQRNVMDLASAQIFSPPCFSFLLLLSASSVAPREAFSQSTVGEKQGKKGEQNLVAMVDGNEG